MPLVKPLLISFSLLAFAGAAAADDAQKNRSASQSQSQQQSKSKPGELTMEDFSRLDKDNDGMLSRAEFNAIQGAAASASAGAGESASAGASAQQGGKMNMSEMRASRLMDMKVVDRQGEDLGEIKDVVVDLETGKVHAAVLEFGGFLGLGEKHYAFPVSELKPGRDDKLALDVDKDQLKNAEGFAKGQWPAMNDEYWGRIGQKGQSSAGATGGQKKGEQQAKGQQQGKTSNLIRASKMIGQDVQDKSGEELGEIKDLVLDLQSGQLKNVVIDVEDAGQATVQANAVKPGTGDKLLISMDRQQLKSQAQKTDR